jgi:polynucleotide 5'-hydroxyl-kinase GRC3/NOL9
VLVEQITDWQETIAAIIGDPGVVVVVGDVDSGKTTFTKDLVNAGVAAGIPTAVVDADTGQSEVGPPAAISMALVDQPVESLRQLKPRRLYFVGSTTPVNHFLPTIVGIKRMTEDAIALGAKLVVVDTSGLVAGIPGRRLKLYEIDLLGPKHVVGLRKARELDHILAVLSKIEKIKLHEVLVSPEAQAKPRGLRVARRSTQFYEYFRGADRHIIRLDDIVCWGTYFTTGRPVQWQHFRELERTLKTKVLHAEVVGRGMYIVADCKPGMENTEALIKRFGTRQFSIVCGTDFSNVLVGLADGNVNTIDLGIIEAIDFKQRHMAVITPAATITPVKIVQFGSMRVSPEGVELGRIKPGEI